MDIKEALAQMDQLDDEQWTADGAPKIEVISGLVGKKVTRQEIIDVAPHFSKENPDIPADAPEEEVSEEDETEEEQPDMEAIEAYIEGGVLPEREFLSVLMDLTPASLPTLEAVLADQLAGAEEAVKRAEDLKAQVKRSLAYTRSRIKREVPDISNQQAIQAYIKSQTEQRQARADKSKELLQGVDIKKLDPRSAIDRAMARKTARGGNRPTKV